MSNPAIAFLPANMDACALYRMFIPHLHISNSRFVFSPGEMAFKMFVEADVAVVQRQCTEGNLLAIRAMRKYGLKVIYDLDDNIWSLPADNPSVREFKVMVAGFAQCALECDAVTVSTQHLKSVAKTAVPGLRNIHIVPNAMDFRLYGESTVKRDDGKIVIGWAGSNTHKNDLEDVWSVLPEVVESHEQVYLEIVGGAHPPAELRGHPRVTYKPWVTVGEFPARFRSWGWDIALAALIDSRFTKSKSNIKILEAAALGAAILVSDVQPYTEFMALAKTQWAVCKSKADWKLKLETLINEPEQRQTIAEEIQRVARTYYSIETLKENWLHVAQQL